MKTHSNLPRVFTKTWLKELRKALANPNFKVTALPTSEPEKIHGDERTMEEIENWKTGVKLIRKHYENKKR